MCALYRAAMLKTAVDYTFAENPRRATGTPIPGFMQGREYDWDRSWVNSIDREVNEIYNELTREVAPPQRLRVPLMNMENLGEVNGVYDLTLRESILDRALDAFNLRSLTKVPVIDFWFGHDPTVQHSDIMKALNFPLFSSVKRRMNAIAKRQLPLVRKAGIVVVNCTVESPTKIDWLIGWAIAWAKFYREQFPGVPVMAWLSGSYTMVPGWPEMTPEHCERLADAIWPRYDMLALWGSQRLSGVMGGVLSRRLTRPT